LKNDCKIRRTVEGFPYTPNSFQQQGALTPGSRFIFQYKRISTHLIPLF